MGADCVTRLAPPDRPQAPETLLRCTRCGVLVAVVELPGPHVDPTAFVGVCCLKEKP